MPGVLVADAATLAAVLPVFLGTPIEPRRPSRAAWVDGDGDDAVDPAVVAATEQIAIRLGARHLEEAVDNPLRGAARVFDRVRATDDLEPMRTLANGRRDDLTDRIRTILDEPPRPVDPIADAAAVNLRRAATRFFRACPLLIAPVATAPAPRSDADVPFTMLSPSREPARRAGARRARRDDARWSGDRGAARRIAPRALVGSANVDP
jgi:hypothetical protein